MLISMSSASAALRDDQTYMDVIANNIANENTNGYKTSKVTFEDLLSRDPVDRLGAYDDDRRD